MITSFTIGLAIFREKVKVILAAGFAILLLVIGVFCVSTSKGVGGGSESCQGEMTKVSSPRVEDGDDDYEGLPMQVVSVVEAKGEGGIPKAATLSSALPWSGLAFCFITGLFDGCLMVPYKLYASSSAVAAKSTSTPRRRAPRSVPCRSAPSCNNRTAEHKCRSTQRHKL